MESINISSRLYDYRVLFTDNFAEELKKYPVETTAYVIDKNVAQRYKNRLQGIDEARVFYVEAVERKKNMDTVMEILSFWKRIGVRKNWQVVCMGGGIAQDVTTIASNLYLRNIRWYFVPTTLLSMCDSCIGGKCGINFGPYKNQIGVFYPPKEIIIDTIFLSTLTYADYLNGWGELLKFSLTNDPNFYEQLKAERQYIPCEHIAEYIHRGLQVKKEVIEADEFESDYRRVLNYGHTFGHALEAYTNNVIPHGQGVIWGLDIANYIAMREGLIDEAYYLDVKGLIRRAFLKEEIIIERADELFEIIKTDKKAEGKKLNFAMLDGHSHLIVYPMQIDEKLKGYFLDYIRETHEYYCD